MNNFAGLDFLKRQRFLKRELKIIEYKSIFHDLTLPKKVRVKALHNLALLKQSSQFKIKNRCIITSRGKAVYTKFGISRILIRNLGHSGSIIGLKKASW